MAESRAVKITISRLAKLMNTQFNEDKGADLITKSMAIEVETEETVRDGMKQLQGYKKPVYIAGTNKKAVEAALEATEGTTVGVMDSQGNIVKKSTRKRLAKKKKKK